VTSAVSAEISSVNTLKRTIQRVRQKEEAAPANPSNFEFNIPDQYRYNSNGELFLKFDVVLLNHAF